MTITALYYKHLGGEGGMQCNAIKKQRSRAPKISFYLLITLIATTKINGDEIYEY